MGVIDIDIRSFSYKGEDLAALKNVRFSVERGELVVLTGNSGCGKTTLMRVMNGLIPDQYEGELDGRIELLGKSLGEFSSGELARTIGNVFQNPTDQFFTRKAADEVALVGENLGMPREELIERVESAFESMKIAHLAGKDLIGLSGGEKQRVAIASTLVYDTQVIFLRRAVRQPRPRRDRGLSPNPRRFEGSRQDRRHRRAQALLSGGSLRQAPRHGGRPNRRFVRSGSASC